ncbi:MAG: hypothetical protein MK041_05655 [Aquabacterium sp.]|nr:hypothetical protein [Aquabacterium sp.]
MRLLAALAGQRLLQCLGLEAAVGHQHLAQPPVVQQVHLRIRGVPDGIQVGQHHGLAVRRAKVARGPVGGQGIVGQISGDGAGEGGHAGVKNGQPVDLRPKGRRRCADQRRPAWAN